MYFTVSVSSPYIGRSFMNGEEHEILIRDSSVVKYPEGLAIDYTSKKSYSNITGINFIFVDYICVWTPANRSQTD